MIDDIKTKFGVNGSQKVNLSDRPKPPSELESLLVEMAEEMFKHSLPAKKKEVKKAKQVISNTNYLS